MAEVFVNYRTGDGDEAAELLARHLSDRFGGDHVFKASRSIQPGEAFPEALLKGARECLFLLAIIGPAWAQAPQLRHEDDWVRREILEAHASAATVVPVLKGRKADRLRRSDLPADLDWLADRQSLHLDTRDSEVDLTRIASFLAERIPALKAADGTSGKPSPGGANSGEVTGPRAGVRSVGGNLKVFGTTHGPVHTGKGDIYQGPRPDPEETTR
jgi:TIR domain